MASDPLAWIDDALEQLEAGCLRRRLATREGPQSPSRIRLDGRPLINFGSNDYLGLAADQLLTDAVREALEETGWGSGASPLVAGREALHARLEAELARFEGTDAALLFPTGLAANLGTISALVGRGDLIFSDAKNHASIVDGCRLAGARIEIYPHGDVDYLRQHLPQTAGFRRRLIVTDSLFSVDGDLAPLAELAELAERHGAMLMIDEAHATGVFGQGGRGVAEHLGVEAGVHVRVGTLSKALGSLGGFVAGRRSLIDWLANRARPYVFSTAPPAAACAPALAALRIVRQEPERRIQLLDRAARLRDRLRRRGWRIGRTQSQIIPLVLGAPERALRLSSDLRERGFFVPAFRPPSVPVGQSLLRISLSYAHGEDVIEQLADALSAAGPRAEGR